MTRTIEAMMEILLVEDNPGDVILTREALKDAGIGHRLQVAHNGLDAADFLFQRGEHADSPRPNLILLDLNLPKKSGREIVREIDADPVLREIPLVILTSSRQDHDVLIGRNPKRSLYIVKPLSFADLVDAMRTIRRFWQSASL